MGHTMHLTDREGISLSALCDQPWFCRVHETGGCDGLRLLTFSDFGPTVELLSGKGGQPRTHVDLAEMPSQILL